jgi:hypothetical protein
MEYPLFFLKVVAKVSIHRWQEPPLEAIKGGLPSPHSHTPPRPPTPSLEDVALHSMVKPCLG